ncbi:jg19210 [Pararge aegeria aegeria]|uniref:Jg19210 protein n=1 Tax=Pararge aegeria aegeria TaxID=348720 RepID=A0A8S4SQC9_9NEOP|nr:jg19210 [Pararge aegeria aegeria]
MKIPLALTAKENIARKPARLRVLHNVLKGIRIITSERSNLEEYTPLTSVNVASLSNAKSLVWGSKEAERLSDVARRFYAKPPPPPVACGLTLSAYNSLHYYVSETNAVSIIVN